MQISLFCDAYRGQANLKADWLNDHDKHIHLYHPLHISNMNMDYNWFDVRAPKLAFELHVPYGAALAQTLLNEVYIIGVGFRIYAKQLVVTRNEWFNNDTRLSWHCTCPPIQVEFGVNINEYDISIQSIYKPNHTIMSTVEANYKYLVTVSWELPEGPFPAPKGHKPLGWLTFEMDSRRFPRKKEVEKTAILKGADSAGLTVRAISNVPDSWDKPEKLPELEETVAAVQ